jgi:hypothetical protein
MSLTAIFSDLIGKYSVTGVLKERLELESARADFELLKARTMEAELRAQVAGLELKVQGLEAECGRLPAELTAAKDAAKALELQRDEARKKLADSTKISPETVMDIGAEVTLGGLMNHPGGIVPLEIFRGGSLPVRLADVMVWINEFVEHGWVVGAEGETFKLTETGRRFARDYFARNG